MYILKEEFKNRMIKLPSCTIYYILSLHKFLDTLDTLFNEYSLFYFIFYFIFFYLLLNPILHILLKHILYIQFQYRLFYTISICQFIYSSKACLKSSIKSFIFSRPTATLIREYVIPLASLSTSGISS